MAEEEKLKKKAEKKKQKKMVTYTLHTYAIYARVLHNLDKEFKGLCELTACFAIL